MRKFLTTLLLLVFMAPYAMRADEIIIGTGTEESYNVPFCTDYTYSWCEIIYPGSEIGSAGTIHSIAFHCNAADTIPTTTLTELDVYMGITQRDHMSSNLDWTPAADLSLVYSGVNVVIGDTKWETIKLDEPFYYSGDGNLVIAIAKKTDYDFNMQLKWYYTKTENTAMYRNSDGMESIADEFPNGNQASARLSYRANIKIEMASGELDSPLSINPSSLELGNRPIGSWMRPSEVVLTTEEPLTISSITSTNSFFTINQVEMPYELTADNSLKLKVSHFSGNEGQQNGDIIINHTFGSDVISVTATAYTPQTGDVWEMPNVVSSYPFVDSPEYTTLKNNYMLPGDEPNGADVVYRLNFSEETIFSAAVTGNNGKVALYAANFNGKGGPDVNNYYGAEPDDDDDDNNFGEILGDSFFFDFNNGSMEGWKTKDVDGDYYNWAVSNGGGIEGYGGTKCIYSESYSATSNAALTPDNYIYSDGLYTITENSVLSFYALPQDNYYSDEHYGVVVSIDGVNFTTVWEHTVAYDEVAEWQYKTVDLSGYAGRNVFVGLRHFNCTNEYAILIDNVQLTSGRESRGGNISNQTVPAGVYYLVASATEQFSVSINTKTAGGYNTVAQVVAQEIDDNKASIVWSWDFINKAKEETPEVSNFKLYRKNINSQEEAVLVAGNVTDTTYVDATWGNVTSGVYRYGVSVVYTDSKYETPIVWSNNIDKDMTTSVTVNVEAANGASVAGTHVYFVSVDDVTYSYETTLDATGSYTWNDFRVGTYKYTISLEGFESCATDEVIEITEATVIDCTLEEKFHVGDFYVSPTGWAMWNDDATSFQVKLNGQNVAEVTTPYYQFDVTNLVQGQEYTATVVGNATMEYTWTYNSCENFVNANDFEAVVNGNSVELSWQLPIGAYSKEFMFDFENATLDGFVTIDANGDGATWMNSNQYSSVDCGYQSHYSAISCSYYNFYDIEPDDYLVTAKKYEITANSKLIFRACAENQMYCAEHYGVAISTESNTNASDFTMIWEETMSAKEGAKVGRNDRAQGTYYEKTVDLSAYAGQDVYIAIRHFDCFGQFFINIDNLTLTTTSKDEPNITELEVLGAMVYRNGELITAEPIDGNSYTDMAPGYGDIEYSIRVVYGGEEDSYYAMSCPLTEEVNVVRVCDAPKNLYGEEGYENGESGVALVWPYTLHGSEWLYYDDNTVVTALGIGGEPFHWGIMFPAEELEYYGGTYLTKVSMYDKEGHDGNINIYYGGDEAPEVLVHSQPYVCTGVGAFVEFDLTAPLPIDPSMNLWVTFNNNNGSFPAAVCNPTGNPNGRWISFDGSYWVDVATQAMNYTWMIRAFVTSELKGTMELDNREEVFEHYNVYRGTSSSNMEIIAEPTVGNYFDAVEPGTYYYQVTSVYTIDGEECESAPANSYEDSEQDYIVVEVTSIYENGVEGMMIYPNPTKGNLNITAENMNRITITNTLGQVVYDIAVDSDNAIIDMTQFEAGVYMVRIVTDNGVAVERISKF